VVAFPVWLAVPIVWFWSELFTPEEEFVEEKAGRSVEELLEEFEVEEFTTEVSFVTFEISEESLSSLVVLVDELVAVLLLEVLEVSFEVVFEVELILMLVLLLVSVIGVELAVPLESMLVVELAVELAVEFGEELAVEFGVELLVELAVTFERTTSASVEFGVFEILDEFKGVLGGSRGSEAFED